MVRAQLRSSRRALPNLRIAVALGHTGMSASGLGTSVIGSGAWASAAGCWARFVFAPAPLSRKQGLNDLASYVCAATRTRPVSSRGPRGERLGPRLNAPRLRQACGRTGPATPPTIQSLRFTRLPRFCERNRRDPSHRRAQMALHYTLAAKAETCGWGTRSRDFGSGP